MKILIIIFVVLISGCINEVSYEEPSIEVIVEVVPIENPQVDIAVEAISDIDSIIANLYLNYAPKKEYVIHPERGSEVYVCSHFGCDMAKNLIGAGYNAGVVVNYHQQHALTWVDLDGIRYVIEPQNGGYWLAEEYDIGRNINIVSLKKGREHMKAGSESLHR